MSKKILYLGNNPTNEYKEIQSLLELGYEVFSLGEQLTIAADHQRYIRKLVQKEYLEEFWKYHPNYKYGKLIQLHHSFASKFDCFIFSDHVEYLSLNWKILSRLNKKVLWVWRKAPRLLPSFQAIVSNLETKGLKTIALSEKGRNNSPLTKEELKSILDKMFQ